AAGPVPLPGVDLGAFAFLLTPPPATAIYTLSLHDALPISLAMAGALWRRAPALGVGVALATTIAFLPTVAAEGRAQFVRERDRRDRKSTRLNSSHVSSSYAVFCLKKKNTSVAARARR